MTQNSDKMSHLANFKTNSVANRQSSAVDGEGLNPVLVDLAHILSNQLRKNRAPTSPRGRETRNGRPTDK